MKKSMMVGLLALSLCSVSYGQQTQTRDNRSGSSTSGGSMSSTSMSMDEFNRVNKEGAAKVAAVMPTNTTLSQADQNLMRQVAMGGMMQLEVSRIAVEKAQSEEVRKLAQAEVEEQTGLAKKLAEIAQAKGMNLPMDMDSRTQAMVNRMRNMTGANFDQMYLRESGVNGHKMLDQTMAKVQNSASDQTLKALAAAAHPLVMTHMQVAQSMLDSMKGGGSSKSR